MNAILAHLKRDTINWSQLNILMVGDTKISEVVDGVNFTINCEESITLNKAISMANNHLDPNVDILIVSALLYDFLKPRSHQSMPQGKKFLTFYEPVDYEGFLQPMQYHTKKWLESYPKLMVYWLLPYPPDLLRYYKETLTINRLNWIAKPVLIENFNKMAKNFCSCIKELKMHIERTNLNFLDLNECFFQNTNFLQTFKQESTAWPKWPGSFTTDGIHCTQAFSTQFYFFLKEKLLARKEELEDLIISKPDRKPIATQAERSPNKKRKRKAKSASNNPPTYHDEQLSCTNQSNPMYDEQHLAMFSHPYGEQSHTPMYGHPLGHQSSNPMYDSTFGEQPIAPMYDHAFTEQPMTQTFGPTFRGQPLTPTFQEESFTPFSTCKEDPTSPHKPVISDLLLQNVQEALNTLKSVNYEMLKQESAKRLHKSFFFSEYFDKLYKYSWMDLFVKSNKDAAKAFLEVVVEDLAEPKKGVKVIVVTESEAFVDEMEKHFSSKLNTNVGINDNVQFGSPIILVEQPLNLRLRMNQKFFRSLTNLDVVIFFGDALLDEDSSHNSDLKLLLKHIFQQKDSRKVHKIFISESGTKFNEVQAGRYVFPQPFLALREFEPPTKCLPEHLQLASDPKGQSAPTMDPNAISKLHDLPEPTKEQPSTSKSDKRSESVKALELISKSQKKSAIDQEFAPKSDNDSGPTLALELVSKEDNHCGALLELELASKPDSLPEPLPDAFSKDTLSSKQSLTDILTLALNDMKETSNAKPASATPTPPRIVIPEVDESMPFPTFLKLAGLDIAKKYKLEEQEVEDGLQANYETYIEVPDMHPDYDEKYEEFIEKFKVVFGPNDNPKEDPLWINFWKLSMQESIDKKRKDNLKYLQRKFREKYSSLVPAKSISNHSNAAVNKVKSSKVRDSYPTNHQKEALRKTIHDSGPKKSFIHDKPKLQPKPSRKESFTEKSLPADLRSSVSAEERLHPMLASTSNLESRRNSREAHVKGIEKSLPGVVLRNADPTSKNDPVHIAKSSFKMSTHNSFDKAIRIAAKLNRGHESPPPSLKTSKEPKTDNSHPLQDKAPKPMPKMQKPAEPSELSMEMFLEAYKNSKKSSSNPRNESPPKEPKSESKSSNHKSEKRKNRSKSPSRHSRSPSRHSRSPKYSKKHSRRSPKRESHRKRSPSSRKEEPPKKEKVSEHIYSISNAIQLLEHACEEVGTMGMALKAVLQEVKQYDMKKVLLFFADADNQLLVNIAINKFKTLKVSDKKNVEQRERTIVWVSKLISQAEKFKKLYKKGDKELPSLFARESVSFSLPKSGILSSNPLATPSVKSGSGRASASVSSASTGCSRKVDIEAIAKATFGSDTGATYQFIKNTFIYKGWSAPSQAEFEDIFQQVSAVHFKMAMS